MNISELESLSYDHPILFYDGVCHLCDGFVNWLIPKDKHELFLYCPLQSEMGAQVMRSLQLGDSINTVLLLYRGNWYDKSDVTIQILSILGGSWKFLLFIKYVPLLIRNKVYDWVAHNRYRWFGKSDQCIVPHESIRKRFLL